MPEYAFEYQFHYRELGSEEPGEEPGGEPGFQPCSYDTAAGIHRIDRIPAGFYVLVEAEGPEGYWLAEPKLITVEESGAVQRYEMENRRIPEPEEPAGTLLLEKLDADTKDVLAGARFEIKNTQTGDKFQMETGEDGTAVSPLLPAGKRGEDGTWALYEYEVREVRPPDGYEGTDQVWSFQFEGEETENRPLSYKLTIEDERTELLVSKTDGETGEPVEGARLAVYPMAGEKEAVIAGETEAMMDGVTEAAVNGAPAAVWTSGTEPYLISGKLIAGGSYLLYEQEPPTGYAKAFPVRFQLSEDGTFVRELETAGAAAPLELEMLPQGSFRITASPVKEIQYFIERDGYPIPKEAIADGDLLTIRLQTVFQNGDKAPAGSWTFRFHSSETAKAELEEWLLRICGKIKETELVLTADGGERIRSWKIPGHLENWSIETPLLDEGGDGKEDVYLETIVRMQDGTAFSFGRMRISLGENGKIETINLEDEKTRVQISKNSPGFRGRKGPR